MVKLPLDMASCSSYRNMVFFGLALTLVADVGRCWCRRRGCRRPCVLLLDDNYGDEKVKKKKDTIEGEAEDQRDPLIPEETEWKGRSPCSYSVDYMDTGTESRREDEIRNEEHEPGFGDLVGVIANRTSVPTYESRMPGKGELPFSSNGKEEGNSGCAVCATCQADGDLLHRGCWEPDGFCSRTRSCPCHRHVTTRMEFLEWWGRRLGWAETAKPKESV
nr:uncharacterized protein LOC127302264 isoform X2 [Lolium perenne]